MSDVRISVIVCTYNRSALLAGCLESLERQTLASDRFEVIVVDNNSADNTVDVVDKRRGAILNLRYVFERAQGLSHARNRGSREAAGDYLAYVDDDARAPATYLSAVLKTLDLYQPHILGGPVYPFYTDAKPRWFKDKYEIRQYTDVSGFSTTCGISGSNFVIRRDLLKQLGGFDPSLGMRGREQRFGEERKVLETYRNITPVEHQRVYYDLDCPILHHVPRHKMSIGYILRRGFQAGRMTVMVTGRGATPRSLADVLARYPGTIVRSMRRAPAHGVPDIDGVEVLRSIAIRAGKLVECIRQISRGAARGAPQCGSDQSNIR